MGTAVLVTVLPFIHGDVTWYDAGELSVAAAGLGVPHPTGFPLFTILGHLFASLPVGSIPFRLALLSACSIALATGLISSVAIAQGACPKRSALGALLAATKHEAAKDRTQPSIKPRDQAGQIFPVLEAVAVV